MKGVSTLVDSSSPRRGEKASYYSAECLETGEVEWMDLEGNSNSETSACFLRQLGERHHGPLQVIWDNAPAHRGEAVREYLQTPGLGLRLVNLPGYSPDFNADEAIWGWAREEATGNLCLGTRAVVRERVGSFLVGLARRKEEVRRRCRNSPAIKSRSTPARLPAPGKCTSHLGFSLVFRTLCNDGLIGAGAFPAIPGLWRQPPGNPAFHPSFQGCWSTSITTTLLRFGQFWPEIASRKARRKAVKGVGRS